MQGAQEASVRIGYVRVLYDYLNKKKIPVEQVFSKEFIKLFGANNMEVRMPVGLWADVLENAVQITRDSGLP